MPAPLLWGLLLPLALAASSALASPCLLSDEELVATTSWQTETPAGEAGAGEEPVTYTEYFFQSERIEVIQGSDISASEELRELRDMVSSQSETNAMVLLKRYFDEIKSRDPDSPDVKNASLVLEHQAGQVFQLGCAESLVLARLLSVFSTRKVEVNYYIFASDKDVRLYFALPDRVPAGRLTLRSELAKQHLASGELDGYDFRVVGFSQGFLFEKPMTSMQEIKGGELVPSHTLLPELKKLAGSYNAQIAMTNGFETMSFDSYELSLMSCPSCQRRPAQARAKNR